MSDVYNPADVGNMYAQYASDMYAWSQANGFITPSPQLIQPNIATGWESDYYNWASQYTTAPTPGIMSSYTRVDQPVLATLVSNAWQQSYPQTQAYQVPGGTGGTIVVNATTSQPNNISEFTFLGFTGIMAILVLMLLLKGRF